MTREDWLKVVELKGCGEIPCSLVMAGAVWNEYRDGLTKIVKRYPDVFNESSLPEGGRVEYGARNRLSELWRDRWGCTWNNAYAGIEGQVVEHPLADWDAFDHFAPPDPAHGDDLRAIDWPRERATIETARKRGELTRGSTSHGFLFQRLYYLRGFENLMIDFATREPRLGRLIEMILEFNLDIVRRYLEIGVDVMHFGDDLGMQERLTISPADWRRYIKPAYARLFGPCREAGAHVILHSDGYIVDIMPDLVEIGVTILNPQDLCNGLENIRRHVKGKVCIDLDVDRQKIVPFGTPDQIERHVQTCVETLGSPEGGLMLVCGIYPGTPLANIEAVARGMSRCRTMFCDAGRSRA